jgi:hypothetical protein
VIAPFRIAGFRAADAADFLAALAGQDQQSHDAPIVVIVSASAPNLSDLFRRKDAIPRRFIACRVGAEHRIDVDHTLAHGPRVHRG